MNSGDPVNHTGSHPNYVGEQLYWNQSTHASQYAADFAGGANAINLYFSTRTPQAYTNFHILASGIIGPTTNPNCALANQANTLNVTELAILTALQAYNLPARIFGAAVHPYGYSTIDKDGPSANGFYWPNISGLSLYNVRTGSQDSWLNVQSGACWELDDMINNWHSGLQSMLGGTGASIPPLVISETNYDSVVPFMESEGYDTDRNGAYLDDLFTWITDHYSQNFDPTTLYKYPLRVLWFSASDDIDQGNQRPYLGLYQRASPPSATVSALKAVSTPVYCSAYFGPRFHTTSGTIALDVLYNFLSASACY
jgi:hypothetical protein